MVAKRPNEEDHSPPPRSPGIPLNTMSSIKGEEEDTDTQMSTVPSLERDPQQQDHKLSGNPEKIYGPVLRADAIVQVGEPGKTKRYWVNSGMLSCLSRPWDDALAKGAMQIEAAEQRRSTPNVVQYKPVLSLPNDDSDAVQVVLAIAHGNKTPPHISLQTLVHIASLCERWGMTAHEGIRNMVRRCLELHLQTTSPAVPAVPVADESKRAKSTTAAQRQKQSPTGQRKQEKQQDQQQQPRKEATSPRAVLYISWVFRDWANFVKCVEVAVNWATVDASGKILFGEEGRAVAYVPDWDNITGLREGLELRNEIVKMVSSKFVILRQKLWDLEGCVHDEQGPLPTKPKGLMIPEGCSLVQMGWLDQFLDLNKNFFDPRTPECYSGSAARLVDLVISARPTGAFPKGTCETVAAVFDDIEVQYRAIVASIAHMTEWEGHFVSEGQC